MTTETRKPQESHQTLWDISVPGRSGVRLPESDVPAQPLPDAAFLREELPLPELSELDVVRHFTRLSQKNFSVDTNFYPLGSCTMKYNPKINDLVASTPGFSGIHPLQPEETVQGALELMANLQDILQEITGMPACTLAPLAGAHGELSGMLMIRAYHEQNGNPDRKVVLIPDSAHGTNPASATMAGFDVVTVPSDDQGNMDLKALEAVANDKLAGLMITLPSTLGLFDPGIVEVCEIVHKAGGLVYGDGANMNALLGRVKLNDLGFDVVHLNLHKTTSTPHGGGGPGAGPICVVERLIPFMPSPVVERHSEGGVETFKLTSPPNTIGTLSAGHGNFGVLVRSYAYLRALGAAGIRQASGDAVLNANYLLKRLEHHYYLPYDRTCMHEVVFSGKWQKAQGVKALDVSKRLIDYGVHPPTMYFPLIVEEALMIEPTETESKETLDAFVDVMIAIAEESGQTPELLTDAPHNTPVGRLDEARAARQPDLRYRA
ncbi:MAG: aminomethyl-transferring glycine dehydrogenase subunit GcvPB [Chloroflexi bacterium]|nr:aminomethyl-transferring glycine dehydrogenase subunit GcvPB [Chloroflexota bacterium]